MRYRRTLFCLTVILSWVALGSDTVHAQSPELMEAVNRSDAYSQQGQYSEAIRYATDASILAEDEFGPDHPITANMFHDLAFLYQGQGNYVEAGALYKRSLAIREKALGPESLDVASASITWHFFTKPKATTPKPRRSTNELWRSTKRLRGRSTRMWQGALETWQVFT